MTNATVQSEDTVHTSVQGKHKDACPHSLTSIEGVQDLKKEKADV